MGEFGLSKLVHVMFLFNIRSVKYVIKQESNFSLSGHLVIF